MLLDSTGIMLDRTVGAGCNPNVCGLDECLRILREGIDRLDRGGCALRGIYVGGAGFTTGDYAKRIRSALRKRYPNLRIECTTDIMNVIGSAVGDESCLAAICGTGPEVITGSTRLKAGSAQKMVLNMISTGAMIRSGYVCENLMINLKPSNEKLRGRVIRIVRELTGADEDTAAAALEAEDWSIRRAADRLRAAQQVSRQSGRR